MTVTGLPAALVFTAWLCTVGCFFALLIFLLDRTRSDALVFACGCMSLLLACMAALTFVEALTPPAAPATMSAPRPTNRGRPQAAPTGARQAKDACSGSSGRTFLLPAGPLPCRTSHLTRAPRHHYACAVAEHGIASVFNERDLAASISCSCGWRHVNLVALAKTIAMDRLLDEYNAHLKRCTRANAARV